jgi:hypothetical protein
MEVVMPRPRFASAAQRLCPALGALLLAAPPLAAAGAEGGGALALHPDNPHYFLFRGRPAVLITSGEHYGAVLNLDFDYLKYLDALARDGLNLTRTFSGAYCEPQGAFNIARNTLAPAPGRFITPWARSATAGYEGGGNKFDLARWDEAYFRRLRDFTGQASERGIIVEMNLFCPMYEEKQWLLSPMNAHNNVNGVGAVGRNDVHTLDKNGGLLAVQEAMTRRIVEELRDFDNVYYEIANEPYFGGITLEWQHRIADVLTEAQGGHARRKLISQNIANGAARVERPHPAVSIFNFHYATPPDTVALNYGLGKVIGDNETGFRGTGDEAYRREGWDFILAGGGLYNNLDYSFTVGHEDGTFAYPASQPGGGSAALRRQLRVLKDFIGSFDFIHMRPAAAVAGDAPAGFTARALVDPGKAYAIYVCRAAALGRFSVRWTGLILPEASGEYTFHTLSNDGVRLWIDDKPVIDNWTDHVATEDKGTARLEAGKKHGLKLEYFYTGGNGVMKLSWSSATRAKEVVPGSRLRTSEGAEGLAAEYFADAELKERRLARTDATVDFTWDARGPFAASISAGLKELAVELPAGEYRVNWLNTTSGEVEKSESFRHAGGPRRLEAPREVDEAAVAIRRTEG